jgi:hypothetical protein
VLWGSDEVVVNETTSKDGWVALTQIFAEGVDRSARRQHAER